ncbi:PAS/PAC sensor signal transduction histidine kinase [Syntrophobotulus glycolicus DSM 8271]|uniref:Circadian input-output histidine kinase CikA n=1 Tax=Syntrophobotulus glycolicus (strain DSM 8271 / FlGlyR) TaxID=645991 RepID=F0SUK5_SYNGF|nr:PAS domain-containing hybrid sensor histidine kinase/response regulator [Syntrophobotulus glycolicus]ADY55498.1 PAS/PAC sensor signal transduction histidine kinase [Syntrophobotulus glycolicus DSM 8271]
MPQNTDQSERLEFIAAAMAGMGDGVILTDRAGRILDINRSAEQLTGWTEKEAAGKPCGEVFVLVDTVTGKRLESPVFISLRDEAPVGLPKHSALMTREGKTFFISASCSPVRASDGKAQGAVLVFRDIDRLKQIEEELKKERNNLNNVLEALPAGIALVGEDAVVRWVNRPLLELFQIREENILGQRFGNGAHCIYSREKGCGEGEKCRFCEIRQNIGLVLREKVSLKDVMLQRSFHRAEEENCRWLNISFIPLAAAGEKRIVLAIEDITEQKNYEEALQKSRDEAESANRVKSEFLANMSHEIRTPLNGLVGMMDLLSRTDPDEEQQECIRMAKFSANTLFKVIDGILDFSRIEAGKIAIAKISFDLKALLEEVIKIHTVLAEQKGLALEHDIPPDLPPYLTGDPDHLRQILNNLIGNALKFTDRGQIKVSVREIRHQGQQVELEFCVADSGVGISPGKMDLLFKRFSQVDSSVTRRYSGTGLGLAICKQLAELMGGAIRAESEMGKGSVFRFTLVFTAAPGPGPAEREQALSPVIISGSELSRLVGEEPAAGAEQIMILDNQAGAEKCSRVRLGEHGEIIFGKAADTGEKRSAELDILRRALGELRKIIAENRFPLLEEAAHQVKKSALRLGEDELADLSFKTELAARKKKWDSAAQYCLEMTAELRRRDKEA